MSSMTTAVDRAQALAPEEGDARWFLGNLAVVKLTGEDTDGQFSIVELTGAKGEMPPLHVHHRDDETFLILDGAMSFWLEGGQIFHGRPGSIVLAPRGFAHVYRIETDTARWRVISSPSAFTEFLLEASIPAKKLTLPTEAPMITPDELNEIAARYGIEILGPPGTLPQA